MTVLADKIDARHGALVFIKVMQSPHYVEALKRAGRGFATPISVPVILDTGASGTALDRQIITRMALQHRGVTDIHTPSTGTDVESRNVFDATIVLGETEPSPLIVTTQVIECDFMARGFGALVGRDILRFCVLSYDGPNDGFTLSW